MLDSNISFIYCTTNLTCSTLNIALFKKKNLISFSPRINFNINIEMLVKIEITHI